MEGPGRVQRASKIKSLFLLSPSFFFSYTVLVSSATSLSFQSLSNSFILPLPKQLDCQTSPSPLVPLLLVSISLSLLYF
jgi:hypothetical protein